MAFSEVRPYQPGDEVRTIDWNVTARMNEPYVKVFTEERELTVVLVVDISGSQEFGSADRSKSEMAAEVAAMVAFSALANNDRVGLILFSDRVEKIVPPRKGRKHVLRLISDILAAQPAGRGTRIDVGLDWLQRVARRKSVAFLISDFQAEGYEKALKLAVRKHDVVPVVLKDPLEDAFPKLGLVDFEDPETGARMLIDTRDARVRGRFQKAMNERREARTRLLRKLKVDSVELLATADYATALQRFFRARAGRRAA